MSQRVNERTIEYTPQGMKLNARKVPPHSEIFTAPLDVQGAKIAAFWIRSSIPGIRTVLQYRSRDGVLLQSTEPIQLKDNDFTRVQMGTYGALQLPAMFLTFVIYNDTDQDAVITGYGLSQLQ